MADHVALSLTKTTKCGAWCNLMVKTNRIWCACYDVKLPSCCVGMDSRRRHVRVVGDWVYLSWYGPIITFEKKYYPFHAMQPNDVMRADGVEIVSKSSISALSHLTENMPYINEVRCVGEVCFVPEKLDAIKTKVIYVLHINKFEDAVYSRIPRDIHVREIQMCCSCTIMGKFAKDFHKKYDRLVIYSKNNTNGKICGTCTLYAQYLARTHDVIIVESLKHRNTLVKIIRHAILLHYLMAKN